MKNFILDVIHLNNEYTGTGMYMALYFATLLMAAFYIREKKIKDAVLLPSLLMLLGVYAAIPFVHNFIMPVYDEEIRGRFFWILMAPAIAALGCTLFVKYIDSEKKQTAAVLLLIPVLFLSGVFKISDSMYEKPENAYRLPQTTIEISDTVLAEEAEPKLIVPYEIADGFRQYSTRIKLLYGEDATYGRIYMAAQDMQDACREMSTATPNLNFIERLAKQEGVHYIVFDSVYHVFGDGESLNVGGYTEDEDFVGDRTPVISENNLLDIKVAEDENTPHWDLTSFDMDYVGTYGQYLLYRFNQGL